MNAFQLLFNIIGLLFTSDTKKDLEIIALRSQLAFYQEKVKKHKIARPRLSEKFRKLWVFLSRNFAGWKSSLVLVKPETVLSWHRRCFKSYWRKKSQGGRPKISLHTIALIKRIHRENPALSPEKIQARIANLNIANAPAPNTIAKYIRVKRKPPTDKKIQSWQTFLRNHAKGIWAMDFATITTLAFQTLHVFLVIAHDRRKIIHFAITENPTTQWLIQQIRNATPFGIQPKYLLHDNGSVFVAKDFQKFYRV